jgi:nitroreductase
MPTLGRARVAFRPAWNDSHVNLELTPDEVLSTTRAVRRRLDLTRPVEREVIEECLRLAQQAPTASYSQGWHFVIVTDAEERRALADLWRRAAEPYIDRRSSGASSQTTKVVDSVRHLAEHLHEVPVHVIPCVEGRTDNAPVALQAARWASIIPAAWSFMLAARSRGLGSVWTSFHLLYEREAAELLGIPYEQVMQAALIPLAYTIGPDFKPGRRKPLETMVHWGRW